MEFKEFLTQVIKMFLTFESEENEESKIIRFLRRLLDMVKKTEMVIGTYT